jgi:hypothetical protein
MVNIQSFSQSDGNTHTPGGLRVNGILKTHSPFATSVSTTSWVHWNGKCDFEGKLAIAVVLIGWVLPTLVPSQMWPPG